MTSRLTRKAVIVLAISLISGLLVGCTPAPQERGYAMAKVVDLTRQRQELLQKQLPLLQAQTEFLLKELIATSTFVTYFTKHGIQGAVALHALALCKEANIPDPLIVVAIIEAESEFKKAAEGFNKKDGKITSVDRGLMQVNSKTLASMLRQDNTDPSTVDIFDPMTNITYGIRVLRWAYKAADGDIEKALTAYNSGSPHGASKYSDKVLRIYDRLVGGY